MTNRGALLPAAAVAGLVLILLGCGDLEPGRPAGAPAGTSADIAFSFGGRIHLMRADGSRRRRLTGGRFARRETGDVQPAWSPDGKRLAFVRMRDPSPDGSRIYLLDVATGRATALTPRGSKLQALDPAWSPDGRRIAYTRWSSRGDASENAIVVAEADGGGERVLVSEHPGERFEQVGKPAWSPDGAQILYTRTQLDEKYTFRPSLRVADVASGGSRPLADDAGDGAWSPDGQRIAFSGVRDRNGKWCYEQCTIAGEIYVMDSDGTDGRRLTHSRGDDAAPSWSPDGSRIAFASNRNTRDHPPGISTEIYTIRANGSCLGWLTNGSPASRDPAWRGAPESTSRVGVCGSVPRRPLVDLDLGRLRASERSPAYWLGTRYANLLLGSVQDYRSGRALRSYAFFYDDCARYDVRQCRRGLQLQVDPVCSDRTTLAVLDQPSYQHRVEPSGELGRLLIDIGQGDVSIITGSTQVRIFPEAGVGPRRRQLLAAVRALRQLGRPHRPLPPPVLPRDLLARLDRTERVYRRSGSVDAAGRALGITGEQTRRRLRLARALDALPHVGAVTCPRR